MSAQGTVKTPRGALVVMVVAVKTAAAVVGVSVRQMRRLIHSRAIYTVKIGRSWWVPCSEIADFLERRHDRRHC